MNFTDGTSTSQHGGDGIDEDENKYTKVYIGGLRHDIGNDQLQSEFEKFGEVEKAWIARSPHSRGYAFVDFVDPASAAKAIKEMNGKEIFGCKVLVQISRPSTKKKRPIRDVQSPCSPYKKADYESFPTSDNTREWRRSVERSPRRRSRSYDREKRNRSPYQRHTRNRESTKTRINVEEGYSRGGRSRSGDRYFKSYSMSPARSPVCSIENESNGLLYQRKNDTKDDETIARITEAVVKETVPKIYSMLVRELLLQNPLNNCLQSNATTFPGYHPNLPPCNDNQYDVNTRTLHISSNIPSFPTGVPPNCTTPSAFLDNGGNSFGNNEFPISMCNNSTLPHPANFNHRIPFPPPTNYSQQINRDFFLSDKSLSAQNKPSSTNYSQSGGKQPTIYPVPLVKYPMPFNGNTNVSSSPRIITELKKQQR